MSITTTIERPQVRRGSTVINISDYVAVIITALPNGKPKFRYLYRFNNLHLYV